MHTKFVPTNNVKRFLGTVQATMERDAREAGWIAVQGDRGLGKTRTLMWWTIKHQGVYLRAKAEWTPRWMLEDLALELKLDAEARRKKDLFNRVLAAIAATGAIVVVDEIELEKIRGNVRLLETLRDLSDMTEREVIIGGDEAGIRYVMRHSQFSSRVFQAPCVFQRADLADAQLLCDQLAEVKIAPDLVAELLRQSSGWYRELKNGIGTVERFGKANGLAEVTAAHVAGMALCINREAKGRR